MDYSTKNPVSEVKFEEIQTLCLSWDPEYVIENLPPWVYKNHPMPRSVNECIAKITALEHTLMDMDLQIEVKNCEKRIAQLANNYFDDIAHEEKVRKIYKAKQSTLYVISALKYWHSLNHEPPQLRDKLNALVELLAEDPVDFVDRVKELLY